MSTVSEVSESCRNAVEALRRNIASIAAERKPRVLIIEDDAQDAELLRRQIKQQCVPTEVEVAATCEEAIPKIQHGAFDLVFLDLRFPTMSGVELLREAKSVTPFIAISGVSEDARELKQALEEGALAVFRKPFADEQMRMICGLVAA
jgi:two-component system, CitB family, response regulator